MRKFILLLLLTPGITTAFGQLRQWDRPMQLKNCSIEINADMFVATTFIEMEFFNPNKTEIEGLYQFELKPGQVITAFQLELNGKYRDGSIEEKWKATNAYNTIVGKRIDPALLTMNYPGHFSLRIYPVPAAGSRRITMTIREVPESSNDNIIYSLPLKVRDTLSSFNLKINVAGSSVRPVTAGLIETQQFNLKDKDFDLKWTEKNIVLNQPLSFKIPFSSTTYYCLKGAGAVKSFALRFRPGVSSEYTIQPKKITVFWDASASAEKRNISKEINFLKQFISYHAVNELTIIPFNHKILDTVVFYAGDGFNRRWQQYLQGISYNGATQLGVIDMTNFEADMFLLFSDGNNTYGKRLPKQGTAIISCIHSSTSANVQTLTQIAGSGGGKVIDLNKISMNAAIASCSKAVNWLINISAVNRSLVTEQILPLKPTGILLINGIFSEATDTLVFQYGNNSRINYTERIPLNTSKYCTDSTIDRITMLNNYQNAIGNYSWSNMIDFGLKEKIVTPHTAYIVLERTEDYIKYNITPPADLEEECRRLNYVKRDTRFERNRFEKMSDYDVLNNVVKGYNERIKNWDANEKPLILDKSEFEKFNYQSTPETNQPVFNTNPGNALSGNAAGMIAGNSALSEVVVTAYGTSLKKNLTGSVVSIYRQDILSSAMTVEQALQGRVSGLQVTQSGVPGSMGTIRIRGVASLTNSQPLYVIDGIPISGNINDAVSVNDIESITVLKDAASASLYGSRAVNGAIIITTKKGKWYNHYNYNRREYRLKDMEDVEYMQELKAVVVSEKPALYDMLKEQYGAQAGFYLDAARHFYDSGLQQKAFEILLEATEMSNGSQQVLIGMAYILESWKLFPEAISIYTQLAEDNPNNVEHIRNLGWAYYQVGNYQMAVDWFYKGIKLNTAEFESQNHHLKVQMLSEMNAIISAHRNKVDTSLISINILKSLPVDIRIVLDCNSSGINNMIVNEPGNKNITVFKSTTTKSGRIYHHYDYWNRGASSEYQFKNAILGKYKLIINYYGYYNEVAIPSVVRIREFKNFGKENQTVETKIVMIDNQNGEIEIGEMKWK